MNDDIHPDTLSPQLLSPIPHWSIFVAENYLEIVQTNHHALKRIMINYRLNIHVWKKLHTSEIQKTNQRCNNNAENAELLLLTATIEFYTAATKISQLPLV